MARPILLISTTPTTTRMIGCGFLVVLLVALSWPGWLTTAQTVKINVFTANTPQVGINGGFNVQTSGAFTNMSGLTYRDTYPIADVFDGANALALQSNALGVIGESTMLVDEYEVTEPNVTLLDVETCRQFFSDLDGATEYYRFDSTLKNTTAFFGVHQGKWLVLLPRGYRVNEQVSGYGTVFGNSSAFVNDGVPAKALIGSRKGSCGIRWTTGNTTAQTILLEFGDPGATNSTVNATTTTNTTTGTGSTTNTTTGSTTNTTIPGSTTNTTTGSTTNTTAGTSPTTNSTNTTGTGTNTTKNATSTTSNSTSASADGFTALSTSLFHVGWSMGVGAWLLFGSSPFTV
jgi:hypothetical protein